MRLAELSAEPDGKDVRLITRDVDLRYEDDVRLECRGERAHQFAKKLSATLGGDAGVDDADQLDAVLAARGTGCQLCLGGKSLRDLLAQLRVGLLQREISRLETLLVLAPLELGTGAPREDPQNLEVDFTPIPLARIEHREMAADARFLVA